MIIIKLYRNYWTNRSLLFFHTVLSENIYILLNKLFFVIRIILHDKPRMLQRHDSIKEMMLIIYIGQKLKIITATDTKANGCINIKIDLAPQRIYDKRIEAFFQSCIFIIITNCPKS